MSIRTLRAATLAALVVSILIPAAASAAAAGQETVLPDRPRVLPLPDVRDPRRLWVEGGLVYILAQDISIRSFSDGRVLKRIGRVGAGAREVFDIDDIAVLPDRLVVLSGPVLRMYSFEGEFLSQARRPAEARFAIPLGAGIAGFGGVPVPGSGPGAFGGWMYDTNGRPTKPFTGYHPNAPAPRPAPRPAPPAGPPGSHPPGAGAPGSFAPSVSARDVDFAVLGDRIFVADPDGALAIAIFDAQGRLSSMIRPPAGAAAGAPADYRKAIQAFKGAGGAPTGARAGVRPPIASMLGFRMDGETIYMVTPARKDDRLEVLAMDLRGAVTERSFRFPVTEGFDLSAGPSRLWDFEDGKACWIQPEERGRGWVLCVR